MERRDPVETPAEAARGHDEMAPGPDGVARGHDDEARDVDAATFRDALAHWPGAVTLVAVRDDGAVHATTVSSFFPVSADPPLVALSLGASAQVLPWLDPGVRFTINLLSADQAGLAVRYADAYPVGPSPFTAEGEPVLAGALATLVCDTVALHPTEGGARIVVARVTGVAAGSGGRPLLRHRRRYTSPRDDDDRR